MDVDSSRSRKGSVRTFRQFQQRCFLIPASQKPDKAFQAVGKVDMNFRVWCQGGVRLKVSGGLVVVARFREGKLLKQLKNPRGPTDTQLKVGC